MSRLLTLIIAILLLPLLAQAESTQPGELTSSVQDQTGLALTIYNNDLALIRDTRSLNLPKGLSRLAFADVSARIRPETARLYGDLVVLEQNFDYDLLSPQKLLEKYVGREVGLVRIHPQSGEEKLERGRLLSAAEGGVVFRFADRIETGGHNSPWRFVFDELPANLRERPTLTMLIDNPGEGDRQLELAYLSQGLSWQADYVATLSDTGEKMDLTAWVTLKNESGAGYRNARLQLLAGDVRQEPQYPGAQPVIERTAQAAPAPMRREELFEYHLYTLERPTSLADRQTKQVLLMQADQIPITRQYRIDTGYLYPGTGADRQELSTQVLLRFSNERPALGEPLPAGTLRFYQRDHSGNTQFIGESRIGHTPEGRTLELTLGNAFDITAARRQTEFREGRGEERESAWEIEVFNAKPEPVRVAVLASFPGEWKILKENLPHEQQNANTARWTVEVPAKGRTLLGYRVRTR